jgi:hypothetical protein
LGAFGAVRPGTRIAAVVHRTTAHARNDCPRRRTASHQR